MDLLQSAGQDTSFQHCGRYSLGPAGVHQVIEDADCSGYHATAVHLDRGHAADFTIVSCVDGYGYESAIALHCGSIGSCFGVLLADFAESCISVEEVQLEY